MRWILSIAIILTSAFLLGAADRESAPYWADRVESAYLPLLSLRADLAIESHERGKPILELHARLARVRSASGVRSILVVENPAAERRVFRYRSTSSARSDLERSVFSGDGQPVTTPLDRHDRILRTAFTYEDLGFVGPDHLEDAEVRILDLPQGEVVRLTTKPYGPYARVILYLDPKTAIPSSVEYFDKTGVLRRTVKHSNIDSKGVYHFPLRIEATEVGTGRRSVVKFKNVKLGATVHDWEFRDRELQQTYRELTDVPPAL